MSLSDCIKTSNNKYSDCPPLMSDGRHFTDYRPSNEVELLISSQNNLQNSYQLRQYLTNNGKQIMQKNREIAVKYNGCSNCATSGVEGFDNGTMLPEKYIQTCDANSCSIKLNDPNGVGLGRSYYAVNDNNLMPTQGIPYSSNNCMGGYGLYAKYGNLTEDSEMARNASPLGGRLNEHKMVKDTTGTMDRVPTGAETTSHMTMPTNTDPTKAEQFNNNYYLL
jgi:hypothetical protein